MSQEARSQWQTRNHKLLITSLICITVAFLAFVGILWRSGFLTFSGTAPSAQIVAAAITLVGGFIGALISFGGIVLKHSLDQRSIALQEETALREKMEADRNNRLAEEAERRLQVEASIKAISLLSTSSGQDVPASQRAGAILILGDLDSVPVALSLASQMLKASSLDSGTACWLYNKALTSKDLEVQEQAAIQTSDFVDKMLLPDGQAVFPTKLLDDGVQSLHVKIRLPAIYALINLLLVRPFSQWDPQVFFRIFDSIHYNWKHDTDDYIKTQTAAALRGFIQAYKAEQTLQLSAGTQTVGELSQLLDAYSHASLDGWLPDSKLRSLALNQWLQQLQGLSDG